MKKMIFALVALVVVASCSETPQDKMEKVIKAAMEKEYPSYEALKFAENVDTVYTKLEDMTAPWQKLFDDCHRESKLCNATGDYEGALIWINGMKDASAKIDSIEKVFKPELVGYTIKHSFKNDDKTYTMTFLLNPELTEVLKSY
jgi:hypothetical protein